MSQYTESELSQMFGRNQVAEETQAVLDSLREAHSDCSIAVFHILREASESSTKDYAGLHEALGKFAGSINEYCPASFATQLAIHHAQLCLEILDGVLSDINSMHMDTYDFLSGLADGEMMRARLSACRAVAFAGLSETPGGGGSK
tara:strand:- start:2204 stop:2641 length:438 start_codon:yes stop_codon:yes gene_type:complete